MLALLDLLAIILGQAGGGGNFGGGGGGGGFGGGGGGFGGGSGFGGGGFSGGGGGGGDLPPGVTITIFVLVAVVMLLGKLAERNNDRRITRTIRKGVKAQARAQRDEALAAIAGRDPAFDLDTFLARAGKGFVTTQYAWSDQDLRSCRPFISDGVHERFGLYIAMQRHQGIRNRMKQVAVLDHEVVAVTADTHFDTIHVRFTAAAISYDESLTTGRRVGGNSDRVPITFTEIWSFSRRPGVQTRTDASLLEGTCPNCGAVLHIVDRASCQSCGSVVNSGAYDWVLAEITQDEEWIVPSSRPMPGWTALQAKDPGLNVQHLEDRTSVIYWRCMMATYFDDPDLAAPVLPPGVAGVPPRWDPGDGHFWHVPAVGSVEVLGAVAGEDVDRVLVQVRWSATRAHGERTDPTPTEVQRIHTDVVQLHRNAGVTSDESRTFTSFSCTNCGAPLDVGKAAECRFCGTPINDGSTDWVVTDVVGVPQARAMLRDVERAEQAAGTVPSRHPSPPPVPGADLTADRLADDPELLVAMAQLAAVDGHLHEQEARILTEMATSRGVPVQRVQQAIATGEAAAAEVELPEEPADQQAFMRHLVRGALADGRISREEHALLVRLAQRLGWVRADLDRLVKQQRRELYQQARDLLGGNGRGRAS